MKTKIFLLALLANLFTLTVSAYDAEIDGIYYNLNGYEASVTFQRYESETFISDYAGDITIPQIVTYEEKIFKVTSIGDYAFSSCTDLTSIIIPNSVTSIGYYAFSGCTSLSSIAIPNSVTKIYSSAFSGCTSLSSITIPNSVTLIYRSAFSGCDGLSSVTIESSNIGKWFSGTPIKEVILGNSVSSIENEAFKDCTFLTTIAIPENVTSIGSDAFNGCSGLTSVTINTPTVGNWFSGSSIKEVTLGNSVTAIAASAFSGCSNLTSIKIPNSVTSIDGQAFNGTAWYDNQPEGIIYVGKIAYTFKGTMPENTTINLKEGTLGIAGSAFSGCSNLTSITIPNSVTTIGYNAFTYCSSLSSITINTPTIGSWFSGTPIKEVTLGNSVTNIESSAFSGCSSLASITIPSSVTAIGNSAFSGCSSLASITIPSSVTDISNNVFSGCSSLKSITIPSSVTTIGGSAFENCNSLTAITIPNSVTSIDGSAFRDCSSLTSIIIPDGVTSIGNYAFQNCRGLTSITIPNSVTSIGHNAFYGCSGLSSITIPNSVTSIGTYVCLGCSNLKTVHLNSNQIVSNTYSSNSTIRSFFGGQVEEYILGENVTSIGAYTFYDCSSLTSVTIPESVTNIDSYAFGGCSSLTSITIPENVTRIGNCAFKNCSSLTSVISNITKPFNIKNDVFQGIDNPCVLYVRKGTKELYTAQTGWNQFADIIEMAQTIIADDKSREYGEPNPSWTYKVIGGKISGVPSITCSATKTSPTGTYDIVVSKGSVTNTDYSYSNGTLTITKAPLKVSVKNCTRYVGDKNPTFELTYSGFKNGETKAVFTKQPTITCNATTNSPVGTYTITVSGGAASNYELSYENGTMTIDALFKDNDFSFLLSGREKEVKLLQAPNTETVIVPENATYNGASYPVTQLADDAFANLGQLKCVTIPTSIQTAGNRLFTGCTRLATIIWNAPLQMTKEMMGNITNPNLLFYTTNTSYAPTSIVNVINSQSKRAERIALADTDGIGDFYCPEEFTASEITYTHTYNQKTERGSCRGWESLALPYDVTEIIHEEKGSITPFGALEKGYELVNGTKPFWLYEYTTRGTFVEAERIEANVPYIISMPYEARLGIEYILKGNVTFKGTNVTVKATSSARAVKSGKYSFAPNYENVESSTAYLLNVAQRYDGNPEGCVFVKNLRSARPFEAYFEVEGSAGVKPYFGVFEHLTDAIRSIAPAMRDGDAEYYQLDGTKRTKLQRGFNIIRTPDGKVQKVMIK